MMVRLSALHAGRPLPRGRLLVLISVICWVDPRAIVQLERLGQLKNPMNSSGIELLAFRLVASCLFPIKLLLLKLKWRKIYQFQWCIALRDNRQEVLGRILRCKFSQNCCSWHAYRGKQYTELHPIHEGRYVIPCTSYLWEEGSCVCVFEILTCVRISQPSWKQILVILYDVTVYVTNCRWRICVPSADGLYLFLYTECPRRKGQYSGRSQYR
jgi:hypothetical protein